MLDLPTTSSREDSAISRQPNTYPVELEGVTLQVTEWPGNSDPVLLLHATGFHSRCWDSIARRLPGAHIFAVDARFHGGSDNHGQPDWHLMANDIEQLLQQLELQRVVAAGHSMGGYITALVAAHEAQRFRQVILIDPTIFSLQVYTEKFSSGARADPAASPVSRRKNRWQSSEEMYLRFKDREPFANWQDEVLRDYCNFALREAPDESDLQLACDPLHEAAMYLNHHGYEAIFEQLPKLTMPVTVMRAKRVPGDIFNMAGSPTWPELASALPQGRDMYLPQLSHFIPMEDPDLVARVIREALNES
jgi:pimeloyl-ACP methyl ester carboxylesterase